MPGKEAIERAEALVEALKAAANGRPCVIAWEAGELARKVRDHYGRAPGSQERPHG